MVCRKCSAQIPDDSVFCNKCGASQIMSTRSPKKRGNGQGTVVKRGNTYTAIITKYANNKRYTRTKGGFKRKKDALDYLTQMTIDKTQKRNITFDELYKEWNKTHYLNISKSKKIAYKIAYGKCSTLYCMDWADIRLPDMQDVVDRAGETYYPKRDIKNLLNLMGQYAIQSDYVDKNFAQYIKLPPLEKPRKDAFTIEEIEAFWKDYEAGHEFTGYILIMIYTGMRYGEISKIKTENIFIKDQYMLGGIKTDAGKEGEIIIPDSLLPIVTRLSAGKDKLLKMGEDKFRAMFDEACKRANVRLLKPHACRHTYSTLGAKSNIQPAILKEMARHKNYSTTLQYTHIDRKTKLNAANSLLHTRCTHDATETPNSQDS